MKSVSVRILAARYMNYEVTFLNVSWSYCAFYYCEKIYQ
jgi:hypothetical protein